MRFGTLLKTVGALAVLSVFAFQTDMAFAAADTGLAKVATGVTDQLKALAKLLNVAAYVAGIGFALTGIMKFKAHKDNPQQVPLSQPIVLLIVSACLLFLPSVMSIAGSTLFTEKEGGGGQTWEGTVK